MKMIVFFAKSAFEDFRRNKLRTILTSLGIFIGVSSVVLLMSFGLGLKKYIEQQFESLGTNILYIMPGDISQGPQGAFSDIRFDAKDVSNLERMDHVKAIVPFYVKMAVVTGDSDSGRYEVAAGTESLFDVMLIDAEYGRIFTKADNEKGAKVAVLGPTVAKKLFGSIESSLGRYIDVSEQRYKVIGVAKSKGGGGLGMPSIDDHIYIPLRSANVFNPAKTFYAIYLQADDKKNISEVKYEAKKILSRRYKEDEFSVSEQTDILKTVNSIFGILNIVLISIAAISLIVGGIGIMNIMFVSVVERIREIGIRRALGARKTDILWLFLTEAVFLSFLGGFLGLAVSFIIVSLLQKIFPAYIDIYTVFSALSVSSVVGIVFGVIPAKKAANLSPIEAIRYE